MGPEGIDRAETSEAQGMNRRGFLSKATVASIGGAVGAMAWRSMTAESGAVEAREGSTERSPSERFDQQIEGYAKAYGELLRDEVLFVDDNGRPIEVVKLVPVDPEGNPVEANDFQGEKRMIGGGEVPMPKAKPSFIEPGEFDENGFLIDRRSGRGDLQDIGQEWLDAVRRRLCRNPGDTVTCTGDCPRVLSTFRALRESFYDEDEPELRAQNPQTYLDVVMYFGDKKTRGRAESRIAYVKSHIDDPMRAIPASARVEIMHIAPGLAAQESHFDNDKTSPDGARGIFQFMPGTWRESGFKESDIALLTNQVRGAGRYLDTIYKNLTELMPKNLEYIQEEFFNGDPDAFNRFFLTPLIINSYNSGYVRVTNVVRAFLQRYNDREAFERVAGAYASGYGHDLYAIMAREAYERETTPGYARHSSEYFARSYALAKLIDERRNR